MVGFPLGLAWSRLRHRPGRALLLALGVAAAAGALAVVLGGSLVAQDVSAGRALGALPESKRAVAVTYADLGLPRNGVTREELEPLVVHSLAGLAPGEPVRAVQYKLLRIGGRTSRPSATSRAGWPDPADTRASARPSAASPPTRRKARSRARRASDS